MSKGRKKIDRGRSRTVVVRLIVAAALLSLYPFPFTPIRPVPSALAAGSDAVLISTATREGRLAVFDDAWARINDRYYDETFHGIDWEAQRVNFRAEAAKAETSSELYAVMRRMIASLSDPHTRVFAPEEKFDWWRPRFVTVGFSLSEVAGLPTVVKVDQNSEPQRAGIRPGDVIETVNGQGALLSIQQRLNAVSESSNHLDRFRAFTKLLDGPAGTYVEVGWKTKEGKKKTARFLRDWQQRELGMRFRREGDIAVIEIDAFTKPIAADFARSIKEKVAGARGLILDLRSNGGGDAEAMSDMASSFISAGTSLGLFTDRVGTSFKISTHTKSLVTPYAIQKTELPLIVLTSERTASAAEILVEALRTSRRARIMGTQTCGCVLAVRTRHLLPDGGLLDVSELDYETAAGARLEKHGINPDETVSIERQDLYARRDRAIESAIDRLSALRNGHH